MCGRFHRANPFDFDIGTDAMTAFNAWLSSKYQTIAQLNAALKDACRLRQSVVETFELRVEFLLILLVREIQGFRV